MISCQWSVNNRQRSVISGEWSEICDQLTLGMYRLFACLEVPSDFYTLSVVVVVLKLCLSFCVLCFHVSGFQFL